jgi:hypothetical protein
MTRRFLQDPLAAAWMAKHFGMRFKCLKDVIDGLDGDRALLVLPQFVTDCRKSQRLFIHPDSLHLLEPQVGDLLRGDEHTIPTIRYVDEPDTETMGAAASLMRRGFKIIQRNGKPFHWPESEAA